MREMRDNRYIDNGLCISPKFIYFFERLKNKKKDQSLNHDCEIKLPRKIDKHGNGIIMHESISGF